MVGLVGEWGCHRRVFCTVIFVNIQYMLNQPPFFYVVSVLVPKPPTSWLAEIPSPSKGLQPSIITRSRIPMAT